MNYRHDYHAGNFADVVKHVVLTRVLTYMKQKPRPFRVIDTHAGAGRYDLQEQSPARQASGRTAIGRLFDAELPGPSRIFLRHISTRPSRERPVNSVLSRKPRDRAPADAL